MIPLTYLKSGDHAIIKEVRGPETLRKQLLDRGVFPGIQFELVTQAVHSPMVIKVHTSRILIDNETSRRIMVQP